MVGELLAALRAIPHIVDALDRLTDATTAMAASQRREEKDELVQELIAAARRRREQRVPDKKTELQPSDNRSASEGV